MSVLPTSAEMFEDMDGGFFDSNQLINYTFPMMSAINFSAGKAPFNTAGMTGLLKTANTTLNAIVPKYDQYFNYLLNPDDFFPPSVSSGKILLVENKGAAAFILCSAILGIVVTLAGLGWCFIRCCCNKGSGSCIRKKGREEIHPSKLLTKRDGCKRSFCGVLFATLVIIFTFGLVCCFVTNQQIKANIKNVSKEANNGLIDTQIYLNTTIAQINTLLITNYDRLALNLGESLLRSGDIIKNKLEDKTGARALSNLTNVVDTVENVWNSLKTVESSSRDLKIKADRLQNGLNQVKGNLLKLLDRCNSPKCNELKTTPTIRDLNVENNFQHALEVYHPKLPNVTDILIELGNFSVKNLRESIDRGRRALNLLSIRIKAQVDPFIPSVKVTIEETGNDTKNIAKNLAATLSDVYEVTERLQEKLENREADVNKYSPYLYYATLIICITLAFIFVLLTCGIFIGFCGKQPGSDHSNECCSRKTGSSFINCGIFFIFLTFLALSAVAVAYFIVGGIGSQVICKAVNSLDNRTEVVLEKYKYLPKLDVSHHDNYIMPSYASILESCKLGHSAYVSLNLASVYDVSQIKFMSRRFKDEAQRLADQVNIPPQSTDGITFLTPETKAQIQKFSNSKVSKMNFESFANQLSETITSVDILDVVAQLNATLEDPGSESMGNEAKTELMNQIMFLEAFHANLLVPMLSKVKESAVHLQSLANYQQDLAERMKSFAETALIAEQALHNSGITQQIRQLAREFASDLIHQVDHYANFTYSMIHDKVGQCDPVYNAFNSTVSSACVNVISPASGFWLALSALLLLFIPILFTGCSLAGLYSKYKTSGYESVMGYSAAYGDGDTIPLRINANNNPHRYKRGGRGRPGPHSAGSRATPNRFDDASHNAWGSHVLFNNEHGGPTPPTSGEYERPPPYYYPGPAH